MTFANIRQVDAMRDTYSAQTQRWNIASQINDNKTWMYLVTWLQKARTTEKDAYIYSVMVEGNLDWLGQISNNFILHRNFHHIIQNLNVIVTFLQQKTSCHLLHDKFGVRTFNKYKWWKGQWDVTGHLHTSPHLEQVVVCKEGAGYFAGLPCSLFKSTR